MVRVCQLNNELLDAEFEGQEIRKKEFFAFYNLDLKKDKLSLDQGQYVMDQAQYIPELAGVVVDAYELRVQVVLSLEKSVKQGLLVWPGVDETMEIVDNDFGTMKQWKQKMLRPGTWGDAVFLRLASLYLETDIFPIPAFREAAENTTLGYTVIRAEKTTSSEPLYLFYFSESEFENPHYQSIRPATEDNILPSLRCQDESSSLLEKTPEPILQSTGVSFQIQDSSLQLPDGSRISSQDVDFVFERYTLLSE